MQERTSAKGNRYAFIQLSDPSGSYEVTIFSELLSLHRDLLWPGTNLLLSVESRGDGDGGRLRVQSLRRLESIAIQARAGLRISVDDTAPIKQLSGMLDHDENGSGGRVSLVLRLDGGLTEVEIELPEKFDVSLETQESLARTPGVLEVLEI